MTLLEKFKSKATTELVASQDSGAYFTETILYAEFISILESIGITDFYSFEALRTTGMHQLFMAGNDTLLISRHYGINPHKREEYFGEIAELNDLTEIRFLS